MEEEKKRPLNKRAMLAAMGAIAMASAVPGGDHLPFLGSPKGGNPARKKTKQQKKELAMQHNKNRKKKKKR